MSLGQRWGRSNKWKGKRLRDKGRVLQTAPLGDPLTCASVGLWAAGLGICRRKKLLTKPLGLPRKGGGPGEVEHLPAWPAQQSMARASRVRSVRGCMAAGVGAAAAPSSAALYSQGCAQGGGARPQCWRGHRGLCQGYLGVIRPSFVGQTQRMLWLELRQLNRTLGAAISGLALFWPLHRPQIRQSPPGHLQDQYQGYG